MFLKGLYGLEYVILYVLHCLSDAVVVGFGVGLEVILCVFADADGTEGHEALLCFRVVLLFLQKLVMTVSEW